VTKTKYASIKNISAVGRTLDVNELTHVAGGQRIGAGGGFGHTSYEDQATDDPASQQTRVDSVPVDSLP
jgi:hypothetical protein